jgi:hypothetical protein
MTRCEFFRKSVQQFYKRFSLTVAQIRNFAVGSFVGDDTAT